MAHSVEDFKNLNRDERRLALVGISELDDNVPAVVVEEAVYNAAGVIAVTLHQEFDLRKISKRDVALFIVARGGGLDGYTPYLMRIVKYIKGYFFLNLQGPIELAQVEY